MAELHLSRSVLDEIRDSNTTKVKIAVSDIDGILRGKYLNKDKFLSAAKTGFGFCSVIYSWDCHDACYDQGGVGGNHNGYPDMNAFIDLSTYRTVPWDNNVPFFLADFDPPNGEAPGFCPRTLLKKVVAKSHDMGYRPFFGAEFEWFNFKETPESLREKAFVNPTPITPGMFGYSILRPNMNQAYFSALLDEMHQFGIPLEALHTETGPGVLEAAILYSDALEAADRAVLFKTAAKEIAHRFGITASFMARWSNALPGCGGHLHQSLWDSNKRANVFYDERDPLSMSETFKHYLAGQLKLMPDLLLMYAPNVNSYKRLVEGYWAPTTATWGVDNRTTAIRVINGGASSTRMETRVCGSDINPYLGVAAALASGLWGIEHKAALPDPVIGNAYEAKDAMPLSRNLMDAVHKFETSEFTHALFGSDFVKHYAQTRRWEWKQFQQTVTTYERERYFEII
jgi:glutamine synthetase